MYNNRGSLWNKWDLHIHTPKSICNNYGGDTDEIWERYINHLENLPKEVTVLGINDYYFIDGFEKVMEYKMEKGRLQNIIKIFPVLEFRIDTFASASESRFQKINLHILFDIDDSNWKSEVKKIKKEFIEQINISGLEKYKTKCLSLENFIVCGNGDIQIGFSEVMPKTEEVFELINSSVWKDRTFTFLGYPEWNNLDKGKQLKEFKEELFNKVDAFFTASTNDSFEKKQQILEKFGDKVLVHASDAHSLNDLEEGKYRCLTWIKARESFEGLKQIIYDPNERIKLQENNPYYDENKTMVLDNIRIKNSNNWFESDPIVLNPGLVSIIGEKGSGKTALLDIIAISNGEGIYEQDINTPYSFYNRAKDIIKDSIIEVKYLGTETKEIIKLDGKAAKSETDKFAKVRYLSLKELESYCDKKDKFQVFIKEIIHSKSKNITDFDIKARDIIHQINDINSSITELEVENLYSKNVDNSIKNKQSEYELHCKNEPKVVTNFTEEQEKLFKELLTLEQTSLNKLESLRLTKDNILDLMDWIKSTIEDTKMSLQNSLQLKINTYPNIDKTLLKAVSFDVTLNGKEHLKNFMGECEKEINNLEKDIESIRVKMQPLKDINANLENEKNALKAWIEKKSVIENELKELQFKKSKIEENKIRIKDLQAQRKNKYKELIETKFNQQKQYISLKDKLESDNSIKFEVRVIFNDNKFYDRENAIINHGSGNSPDFIRQMLKDKIIDKINNPDEGKNIEDAFDCVNDENFISDVFGYIKNYDNLLKKSFKMKDFYNWLYDDYYEVNYYIYYKDKPLDTLSPGQKGLALMKIFLKLDNSTKPLLIDQPEDNLDNKSVFNDLVDDLKEIKKKRQIIIATHNPNLVVNTDSEQVIVAKFEDNPVDGKCRISYTTGGLEDINIRELVCDILEGGDNAFMKREQRYCLKNKFKK